MNKGSTKTGLIISGAILLIVLLVLLFNYFFPSYKWNEIYKPDSKEPYGGYVFANLLKTYNPGKDFVLMDKRWDSTSVMTDTLKTNNNYVFLGSPCYMDSLSANCLLKFVDRGNNALIIAPNIPYDLLLQLGIVNYEDDTMKVAESDTDYEDEPVDTAKFEYQPDTSYSIDPETGEEIVTVKNDTVAEKVDTTVVLDSSTITPKDSDSTATGVKFENHMHMGEETHNYFEANAVNLNFTHPQLKTAKGYIYQYINRFDTVSYYWDYLVDDDPTQTYKFPYTKMGTIGNNHFNFIKVQHGKGTIFINCTPLAFSNYYLLDDEHLEYAKKVMTNLNGGDIYWDEYNRTYHFSFSYHSNGKQKPGESPLRYILSQKSLRWAWYLLLGLLLVYSLFHMKRKQRVIPVLDKNVNTSIEFAETVSRLYFQQNDHRKLALQQMKLFLAFIRGRYYINTSLPVNELVAKISAKSGVPSGDVNFIIAQYKQIEEMPEITEHILIDFYKSLENFYQACK